MNLLKKIIRLNELAKKRNVIVRDSEGWQYTLKRIHRVYDGEICSDEIGVFVHEHPYWIHIDDCKFFVLKSFPLK